MWYMNKITQINIKNISSDKWQRLVNRLPVSPSLIIRALISYALEMSDDEYGKMLNKQAAEEAKK
jgi:hypothetical protein